MRVGPAIRPRPVPPVPPVPPVHAGAAGLTAPGVCVLLRSIGRFVMIKRALVLLIALTASVTAFHEDAAQTPSAAPPSLTASSDAAPTPPAAAAQQAAGAAAGGNAPEDPYLWLEDVTGAKALDWVRERNAESKKALETDRGFKPLYDRLLAIFDSKERIPYVGKMADRLYNFWRDAAHERGLWRRTTLEEYRKTEPAWETVLDLDALAREEKENWVWEGSNCLEPEYRRCLVYLSRGGADATVVREFDTVTRSFVKDGFSLPEAKSAVSWVDEKTLFVGTDFGPGSMTQSGYPRLVKLWKRGTPLDSAEPVFAGKPEDIEIAAFKDFSPGSEKEIVSRALTTYTSEYYLRLGGRLVRLDIPTDAALATHFDRMFVTLRSDWSVGGKTYPAGALLLTGFDDFLRGSRDFTVLFQPSPRTSLQGYSSMKDAVIVNELDNVKSRLSLWERKDGVWARRALSAGTTFGTVAAEAVDPDHSNEFWLTVTDFVTPTSLSLGSIERGSAERLKTLPAFFRADGLETQQFEAVSKDGTRIPYFQVSRAAMRADGQNPSLVYGYGGFETALTPWYSGSIGAGWLERGNVFVVANIRGGNEFGPQWHQAALKENRHRAYEDFIAVAEDLVRRKVTSPRRLGIMGGSNGGLLVTNALTMRPDLFGAVVAQVPLTDMRRYTKLLAGASWMEEYGDPDDPKQWEFIRTFSPYHNLQAGVHYPPTIFTSSTRDDRVHPAHSRKMVARMKAMGDDVLYYENTEGGHGGAATHKQAAFMSALDYIFLHRRLEGR